MRRSSFGFCMNTSTIRCGDIDLEEKIRVTADAGYDGIEPWVSELDEFAARGGDLADIFHMYKGSGHFEGMKLLGPRTLKLLHVNDYPAAPPRHEIGDAQRVYPGEGIAPLRDILRDLSATGYDGMLSLELFNRDYWGKSADTVARTGLDKLTRLIESVTGD